MVSPQIPLQLEPGRPDRFEDFVAGPNQAVVNALRSMDRDSGASLFIHGPPSSGKTHLLNASSMERREAGLPAWYIGLEHLEPQARAGLRGLEGLVCFDGVHAVVGDRGWEEALFHCFNEVFERKGQVIASSRTALSALDFKLPDLASRLSWGSRFKLQALGERDRLSVLRGRARRLELDLPAEVEGFLMRRISRDLGTMLDALEKLHAAARAGKRRVTVPLASEVLSAAAPED